MKGLPPLGGLRAFEATARHLSFKQAAAELGVTPTAISHQIQQLERYCGQPLFRRHPRPIALTWAGQRLFPVLRDGFLQFSEALAAVRQDKSRSRLRVTATNAFAGRVLVPRLPDWRRYRPRLDLDIIGTDEVLDLEAGAADVAIRYARQAPPGLVCSELARDRFHLVAAPALVGDLRRPLKPADLAAFPLIAYEWPASDRDAPTWQRWEAVARKRHARVPSLADAVGLNFREEQHAIEAVLSGQGIAICSSVLVGRELATGSLACLSTISLPGYGFFVAHRPRHPKAQAIAAFADWLRRTM
jgi:LysR family transcriptional regulator, glycine cleavage system transcriptional activator